MRRKINPTDSQEAVSFEDQANVMKANKYLSSRQHCGILSFQIKVFPRAFSY